MFTVLFSDDENCKNDVIDNLFGAEKILITKNYNLIEGNYKRALFQLQNNIFYDFFKFRKPLKKFVNFKILHTAHKEYKALESDKVTIVFDASIGNSIKHIEVLGCTVKEAKKIIYDKIGLSISKQEICMNNQVLSNSVILKNETVVLRQKRRTNKKP